MGTQRDEIEHLRQVSFPATLDDLRGKGDRPGLRIEQADELRAIAEAGDGDLGAQCDLDLRRASYLIGMGELEAAVTAAERAEDGSSELGDDLAYAEALRLRGEICLRTGERDAASECATHARELFDADQAAAQAARTLVLDGDILAAGAQYQDAVIRYRTALATARRENLGWVEAPIRTALGATHLARGRFRSAIDDAICALRLSVDFANRVHEGESLSLLGAIYHELGQHRLAMQHLDEARQIQRATRATLGELETTIRLADVPLNKAILGDYARACAT